MKERKKMKKILPIALVTILAINLGLLMIPSAFAAHTATVTWVESGSDTLAVSPVTWPRWLNFTVYNDGPDGVVEVKFVIQKDGEGNALFKFEKSKHKGAANLWTAIPDEFGPDGYPTVIYFRAKPSGLPIETEETGEFDILFSDGPATCNYKFDLWSADDGSPSGIDHNVLSIIMDGEPPELNIVTPSDGETIEAIFDPYPTDWYLWINFTAADNPDHDSNISRVVVDIVEVGEGPEWDISYPPPYEPEVVFAEKCWNLPNGTYTLTVTVYDGAGNSASTTIEFTFLVPLLVWLDPVKGTVGPVTTKDPETGVWTGSKDEYLAVGGTKVLGTEVTIQTEAGAFTANSKVNVTVEGLPYADALVLLNVPTDSEGKFSEAPSFLFPTAPHDIYTVTLEDAEDTIVELEFTVIPEIVYNPAIVLGPAVIEVIATGLPAYGDVVGLTCNGTDALVGVNWHVIWPSCSACNSGWYTDENGTLQTRLPGKPGLLMPVLEPGTYEIELIFDFYECHNNSISNLVAVVNDFQGLMDALDALELKLDYLKPIIERIDGNVVEIETIVGNIEATLEELDAEIVDIKEDVATIITMLGEIKLDVEDLEATVTAIEGKVATVQTTVGDIKGTVTDIKDDVATVETEVGTLEARVPDDLKDLLAPTPTTLSITAVLAAIAAIASIVAAVVVLRRLKVAA